MIQDARRVQAALESAVHYSLIGTDGDPLREQLIQIALLCSEIRDLQSGYRPDEAIPFTNRAARTAALETRRQTGLSDIDPLHALPDLLSTQLGVPVFRIRHCAVSSLGLSVSGFRAVFLSEPIDFRVLSACAKEFSILLAHISRHPTRDFCNVTPRRNHPGQGPREFFAANFAIELLIPNRGLAIAIRTVRKTLSVRAEGIGDVELLFLARIFGVSFYEAARKCEREKLLPPGSAALMQKFVTKEFGDPEIRADTVGLPNRPAIHVPIIPTNLVPGILHCIASGRVTANHVRDAFLLSQRNLDSLLSEYSGKSK